MPHWPIFDTPRDTAVAGIAVVANVDTDDEGKWRRMNSPNAASPGGTAVATYRNYDTSPLSDELVSYCAHNFHLRAFDPVTGKSSSNFIGAMMCILDGIARHYVRMLVPAGLLTPGRITYLGDTAVWSYCDKDSKDVTTTKLGKNIKGFWSDCKLKIMRVKFYKLNRFEKIMKG